MNSKSYHLVKDKLSNKNILFEYEEEGHYVINPKAKKKGQIEINKIIFVDDDISKKIIRKKIDKKIKYFLVNIKKNDEDDDPDGGSIKKDLMECEKLRIQIMNKYIKYLGSTYANLSIEKLNLIMDENRFKLFKINEDKIKRMIISQMEQDNNYEEVKEGRKGR